MEWTPYEKLMHMLSSDGWADVVKPELEKQVAGNLDFLISGACKTPEDLHYTRGLIAGLKSVLTFRQQFESSDEDVVQ